MVNQLVKDIYTRFLFKIDALPQDVVFSLYIVATISDTLSTDIRGFFISEGVQGTLWLPM